MVFYAVTNNYLDKVPLDRIAAWQEAFVRYMESSHANIGRAIVSQKRLDDATVEGLKMAIQDFNTTFASQG
jgi:F0F1-type ATP synthase alpha subunit